MKALFAFFHFQDARPHRYTPKGWQVHWNDNIDELLAAIKMHKYGVIFLYRGKDWQMARFTALAGACIESGNCKLIGIIDEGFRGNPIKMSVPGGTAVWFGANHYPNNPDWKGMLDQMIQVIGAPDSGFDLTEDSLTQPA